MIRRLWLDPHFVQLLGLVIFFYCKAVVSGPAGPASAGPLFWPSMFVFIIIIIIIIIISDVSVVLTLCLCIIALSKVPHLLPVLFSHYENTPIQIYWLKKSCCKSFVEARFCSNDYWLARVEVCYRILTRDAVSELIKCFLLLDSPSKFSILVCQDSQWCC